MINKETKIIAVSMGKVIGLYEFVNSDNINATFISESGNNLVVDKNINDNGTFNKVSGGVDIQSVDYLLVTDKIQKKLTDGKLIGEIVAKLMEAAQRVRKVPEDVSTTSLSLISNDVNEFVDYIYNVFEGLNRLDNDGKVKPGVATKSVASKDGKTWTFTLRKNARWSNGDQVTANDFVYALQRTVDPRTQSQQQNIYQAVKNANEVVAGKTSPHNLGVKAKDKHTLVVHLTHPVPYFKTMTHQIGTR